MDLTKYVHIRDYDEVVPDDKRKMNNGDRMALLFIMEANNDRDFNTLVIDSLLEPIKKYRDMCNTILKPQFEWDGSSINRNPLILKRIEQKASALENLNDIALNFEPSFQSDESPKLKVIYKKNGQDVVERIDQNSDEKMKATSRFYKGQVVGR